MAIEFDCPSCQSRIRVPDEAAGKKARCPNCQQIAAVPAASSSSLADFGRPPPNYYNPSPASPLAPIDPFASEKRPPPAANPTPVVPPVASPPASSFSPAAPAPSIPYGPPGGTFARPAQPAAPANPFSDAPSGGFGSGPVNPYASPGYGPYHAAPLTLEEVRSRLLGPAIGMTVGAAISIGLVAFMLVVIIASPDFQADAAQADEDFFAGLIALFIMSALGAGPSLVTLLGAYAMYRGKGQAAAWAGCIASVFPCSPCFIVAAGFAIWGMVVLSDARVSALMK